MNTTLWDQINALINNLEKNGIPEEAKLLKDVLEFSSTSLELYFKCSGILGHLQNNKNIKTSSIINEIDRIKNAIDKLIS